MRWRSRSGAELHDHRDNRSEQTGQKADEAVELATSRIRQAQHLLAPYRDDDSTPELRTAYAAVHSAAGDLAAARHWRTLESRMAQAREEDTG